MRRLSLVHIETLCCIARVKTFTAAAERLHTTQSTVSARVREMEVSLGVKLFSRHGRTVELTALGREFVLRAQPLLLQLNGLADMLESGERAPVRVRIGGGPSTMSWLPDVLRQVMDAMPNLAYDLEIGTSAELVQSVESGRLDLGVLAASSLDVTKLDACSLGTEPMQWYVASDLDAAVAGAPPQDLIDRLAVLLMPRSSFYHLRGINALREHGIAPRRLNTCNNTAVMLSLVEGGNGIGLIPERLARASAQAGHIVRVLEQVKVQPIEYMIVRQRDDELPHLDLIIELAMQASRAVLDQMS